MTGPKTILTAIYVAVLNPFVSSQTGRFLFRRMDGVRKPVQFLFGLDQGYVREALCTQKSGSKAAVLLRGFVIANTGPSPLRGSAYRSAG